MEDQEKLNQSSRQSLGRGLGKRRGGGFRNRGFGGLCVCQECGYREEHKAGNPCQDQTCPDCSKALIRE